MLHNDVSAFESGEPMSKLDILDEKMSAIRSLRDQLRERIEVMRGQLTSLETLIDTFDRIRVETGDEVLLQVLNSDHSTLNQFLSMNIPKINQDKADKTPNEIAEFAAQALIEHGRPLKRGALVRLIEAKGVKVPGKDRNKNLGTIMWRHPELIVSLPRLGYWAKGVPIAGVYDPATYVPPASQQDD